MQLISESDVVENKNTQGRTTSYSMVLEHRRFHEIRELRSKDRALLLRKRDALMHRWQEREAREEKRKRLEDHKANQIAQAKGMSSWAATQLKELQNILGEALRHEVTVDWTTLKVRGFYAEPLPDQPKLVAGQEPELHAFMPRRGIFQRLIPFLARKGAAKAQAKYTQAHLNWKQRHAKDVRSQETYDRALQEWEQEKAKFDAQKAAANQAVDELRSLYDNGASEGVLEHCELLLDQSRYPDAFPKSFSLAYDTDKRLLTVAYQLPEQKIMPTLKEVRYIASRDELEELHLSDKEQRALFASVWSQVVLRVLHELFVGDVGKSIGIIAFDGFVQVINLANGKLEKVPLVSLRVTRESFLDLNLKRVDPQICIESLANAD